MSGAAPETSSIEEVMASIRRIVAERPAVPDEEAAAAPAPPLPEPLAGGATVDAFLRSMLEPMLKAWLDANLPEIVEAATRAEIRRLTGGGA